MTPPPDAPQRLHRSGESALVLLSGGQDSATCLAWALARFGHVETLGFDYGQRHVVELECRAALRAGMASPRLGEDHTLHIPTLAEIGGSALTESTAIAMREDGLPNTFVPGRNLVFMTFAAASAISSAACARPIIPAIPIAATTR